MEKYSILFSNPKKPTFVNWCIRKVLRKPYGHTASLLRDTRTGQFMVSEASHGEAHYIHYGDWLLINDIVIQYDKALTEEDYANVVFILNSVPQRGYDFLSLIGILIAMVFKLNRNIFGSGRDKLFCSEKSGMVLSSWYKIEKSLDLFTPKDVEELILANKEDFIRAK